MKVGDFGLVKKYEEYGMETASATSNRHTSEVGTYLYMSPELVCRKLTVNVVLLLFGIPTTLITGFQ